MACLDGLVGVTKKGLGDLPFYAQLSPTIKSKIIVSASGLYIDKLTGGIDLTTIGDLGTMNAVLKSGLEAIEETPKILQDDLTMALNTRYKSANKPYSGAIGRVFISKVLGTKGNLQGQRLRANNPISGYISITKISIAVNGAETFKIYVGRANTGDEQMAEVLHEFPVTTATPGFSVADMSSAEGEIKLPMQINGIAQEYWVYWNRTEAGALSPKDNDIKCNCPNDPINNLLEYLDIKGVGFADINSLKNIPMTDNYGHGLSIQAAVKCDEVMIICQQYENDASIKAALAWAANYKAGELWIEYIFKSNSVERVMIQGREYLWGKRNHFAKEYNDRITWIANNMDVAESNCYECKGNKMFFGAILS